MPASDKVFRGMIILRDQIAYYRARAGEYLHGWVRSTGTFSHYGCVTPSRS